MEDRPEKSVGKAEADHKPLSSNKVQRKHRFRNFLVVIVTFVCGWIFGPWIQTNIELSVKRHHSKKELHWELLAITSHYKSELASLAEKEGIAEFDLSLDDPMLLNYYLVKMRLSNSGQAISGPLKFLVRMGKRPVKITDINEKLVKPAGKSVRLRHSLPHLTWKAPVPNHTIQLTAQEPYGAAGFHLYRSLNENVGYGRMSESMIPELPIEIPEAPAADLATCYYRLATVSRCGLESDLGPDIVKMPDIGAFLPFFENTCWVDPNRTLRGQADGSLKAPFGSLPEALEKSDESSTFIMRQYRDQVTGTINLSSRHMVLYYDDLSFLAGRATVSLPNGIDEGAEILLFFLCKTTLNSNLDPNMRLEGRPEVRFERLKTRLVEDVRTKNGDEHPSDVKVLLMPPYVKPYTGQGTIYLVWERPESSAYKGVRIFRSTKRSLVNPFGELGKELYDGQGNPEALSCKYECALASSEDTPLPRGVADSLLVFLVPPPRGLGGDTTRPAPVTNLGGTTRLEMIIEQGSCFADNTITPGTSYTYTLFAYDGQDNYSYPIFINACLNDSPPVLSCQPTGERKAAKSTQ